MSTQTQLNLTLCINYFDTDVTLINC